MTSLSFIDILIGFLLGAPAGFAFGFRFARRPRKPSGERGEGLRRYQQMKDARGPR
jgi:membrane-associated phospholipid phosphatase